MDMEHGKPLSGEGHVLDEPAASEIDEAAPDDGQASATLLALLTEDEVVEPALPARIHGIVVGSHSTVPMDQCACRWAFKRTASS